MNVELERIRAEERAAPGMRQIRAVRYGRCQFCGQAISEDSRAHGGFERLAAGNLCEGKPKGRRWVSFSITKSGRVHGDSYQLTLAERETYAPVLAEMEQELKTTCGARIKRNVPAVVAPAARIVVFDPDEDWSYPGCELDAVEETSTTEDLIAGYEPAEPPEWTEAEILNEAPDRDSWREAPRLGGEFAPWND